MKKIILLACTAVCAICCVPDLSAQNEAKPDIQAEVKSIVAQVREKLKAGKDTEADLAENLKAIDKNTKPPTRNNLPAFTCSRLRFIRKSSMTTPRPARSWIR
jgi:septal ring factor EnvC (AmiA/AmiB activator)